MSEIGKIQPIPLKIITNGKDVILKKYAGKC